MHDLEYDSLLKKRIAGNARKKKGGSRSKKCTLPSDYLTAAQKRKLNGDVMTYQMNKPVAWKKFIEWPVDLQQQYFEYFAETHGCTASMMAEMMGCAPSAIYVYANRRDELRGVLQKGATQKVKAAFTRWLEEQRGGAVETEESEAETVSEDVPVQEEKRLTFNNCISKGQVCVEGTATEIGVALVNMLQGKRVKATIVFKVIDDE